MTNRRQQGTRPKKDISEAMCFLNIHFYKTGLDSFDLFLRNLLVSVTIKVNFVNWTSRQFNQAKEYKGLQSYHQ